LLSQTTCLAANGSDEKSQGQKRAKTHLTRSQKLTLEKLEDRIYLSANAVDFDLPVWEASYGATSITPLSQGDADGDSDVDGNDFLVWQRSLGQNFFPLPIRMPISLKTTRSTGPISHDGTKVLAPQPEPNTATATPILMAMSTAAIF